MRLDSLHMPCLNTTHMGVVKGALDYWGIPASPAMVFGLSGHAFLINIHKELCPSSPYCWRREAIADLTLNLGLEMNDLGFFSPENSQEDRAAVEKLLCSALAAGTPCSLINLEHQLITGYDSEALFTAQPWAPKVDFPPATLSFGTWREFGDSFHANFYLLQRADPAPLLMAVLESLAYAVELHTNPGRHNLPHYGVGPEAYANWIAAAAEFGGSHGNWWNAMVWSECRHMAARYFAEIGQRFPGVAWAIPDLIRIFAELGDTLAEVGNKEMPAGDKVRLLSQAKEREAEGISRIAALSNALRDSAER